MDLKPQSGVNAGEARTLTGLLRTALHETGAFTLINREDMEEIARNYQIELTVCDDDACLLRLGTLVGAQLLVTGDVGRVFEDYVINLRLVDLVGDTLISRVVTSAVAQGNTPSFQQGMARAALTLAGMPPPGRREAAGRERPPSRGAGRERFVARAGYSPLTGMLGVEYRGSHASLGVGYIHFWGQGIAGGVRYCLDPSGATWFFGLGGLWRRMERPRDPVDRYDLYWAIGIFGGRQWDLGRSCDLAVGAGVNYGEKYMHIERDHRTDPYCELSLGVGF